MAQKAPRAVPEGMHTLTSSLYFNGNCKDAIAFYQKAFGAELHSPPALAPDGKSIWHALLKLGDSQIMMNDIMPGGGVERGPEGSTTVGLYLYVDDCDLLYQRAVAAGCQVLMPMADMFWGDRMGKLKDPFGHVWTIASLKWIYSPEEMKKGMDEAIKQMKR
jgi:uncharacterized glyoxalase superfamily protein PhnB